MREEDLIALVPPGRYFVGDPGRVMRPGLFQDALEKANGRKNSRVEVENSVVILAKAKPACYPDRGIFFNSLYECQSGKLGIVHESLILEGEATRHAGCLVVVNGSGVVSISDGLIRLQDEIENNLVHIDTVPNREKCEDSEKCEDWEIRTECEDSWSMLLAA